MVDFEQLNQQLSHRHKLFTFLYSLCIGLPIHGIILSTYYFNFISSFVFLGVLVIIMSIVTILLIIFRDGKFKSLTLIFITLLFFLFFGYEIRLLSYESQRYEATGFLESKELLKNSGIHILSIRLFDVLYRECHINNVALLIKVLN